jgi:hypothetical protein
MSLFFCQNRNLYVYPLCLEENGLAIASYQVTMCMRVECERLSKCGCEVGLSTRKRSAPLFWHTKVPKVVAPFPGWLRDNTRYAFPYLFPSPHLSLDALTNPPQDSTDDQGQDPRSTSGPSITSVAARCPPRAIGYPSIVARISLLLLKAHPNNCDPRLGHGFISIQALVFLSRVVNKVVPCVTPTDSSPPADQPKDTQR